MIEKAIRLAYHLPWHFSLTRRILLRGSEVSLEEGRFLGSLVSNLPPSEPIIEIGTLFGESTRVMAAFKPVQTPLITVDSFRWNPYGLTPVQHASITRETLADAVANFNVKIVEMDKTAFYATYNGDKPGLVFLDANHSYESTLEDIQWARRIGARMICGHDYTTQFPGVIRAVEENGGAQKIVGKIFLLA